MLHFRSISVAQRYIDSCLGSKAQSMTETIRDAIYEGAPDASDAAGNVVTELLHAEWLRAGADVETARARIVSLIEESVTEAERQAEEGEAESIIDLIGGPPCLNLGVIALNVLTDLEDAKLIDVSDFDVASHPAFASNGKRAPRSR